MNTYIALIRGINLVGRRSLPMKELKVICEGAGCRDVRTYIQSGNVIFRSGATDVERLSKRLAKMIFTSRGFEPYVLVLTRDELKRAAARNPFPEATANHKSLHLFFMGQAPKPDLEKLEAVRAKSERPATTTFAPRSANRKAVSRPIPLFAPTTTTTCS